METGKRTGVAGACLALGLPRATYYRRLRPKVARDGAPEEGNVAYKPPFESSTSSKCCVVSLRPPAEKRTFLLSLDICR
jgi:hypothetical protein